jgi:site-specific DNA-methyltransferase (adenine-specific)
VRVEQLAEGVTLYLADCREVLPTLGRVDAVVTDPPYGIAHSGNSARFSGGNTRRGRDGNGGSNHGQIRGDHEPFDPAHLLSVGHAQIIWGFNNFSHHLPPGALLVWTKRRPFAYGTFLGDGEVAWCSRGRGVYMLEHIFSGSSAAVEYAADPYAKSAHPFQKPIAVMEWCIRKLPNEIEVVCDPYMGSGTTGVAAVRLGRKFTGIEIDPRYFDIACRRIRDELAAPRLFADCGLPSASQQALL